MGAFFLTFSEHNIPPAFLPWEEPWWPLSSPLLLQPTWLVLSEQVPVGDPHLLRARRERARCPLFLPAMSKDPAGLGRGFPLLHGKLPNALNPPRAADLGG